MPFYQAKTQFFIPLKHAVYILAAVTILLNIAIIALWSYLLDYSKTRLFAHFYNNPHSFSFIYFNFYRTADQIRNNFER